MEQKLTQAQLEQVVAEVQRLSQQQQAELDAAQVKDILQELNLPPELLEEALVQVHRREALAAQQRRNRWIIGIDTPRAKATGILKSSTGELVTA